MVRRRAKALAIAARAAIPVATSDVSDAQLGLGAFVQEHAFSLRATNLLDREHEEFGTYSVNARAEGEPTERFVAPGAPLRVVAGLRRELE